MFNTERHHLNGLRKMVVMVLVCMGLAGCIHGQKKPKPEVDGQNEPAKAASTGESQQPNLSSREGEKNDLKKEIAALNMKIMAYEAMVKEMQRRSDSQQKRLDAAIIEVVRTKARLRSIESKAEAASTIAEAEIAVNAAKTGGLSVGANDNKEISIAEDLLKMSIREFKARNFGGALYLANQSKGQVRVMQLRQSGGSQKPSLKDAKHFSQPLPLKALKNTNLRRGPGLHQKILRVLAEGTLVTGHSYTDKWVRVETDAGDVGWVFQPLIAPR